MAEPPSGDQVSAALERMRHVASAWRQVAGALAEAGAMTDDTELTRLEAGLFQVAFDKYAVAPGFFRDRLAEGTAVMGQIAATLSDNANAYAIEEALLLHELNRMW
ncbi:hypothetical protein JGU71_16005 [Antrihabitans sp. YC3-6]|uniref:Uncharacterized protein n=1 Tax=Antrihabitans stalagmiti TaxID=2799499 RepID=A0A934U4F9_9NOCA|nr:hypothetical protein [Antrihabitans stalagmiti]MBJ8340396.1 hypothetical protein [Antrihabitans stalagmiti]